jgi:hypothetical protein
MDWIKRNLVFVVGSAATLVLLGAGGFYIFISWSGNSEASEKLDKIYRDLKTLQSQSPAPGNEKINNTEIAKEQQALVQDWINSASGNFAPIPAIPTGPVTSEAFASALRRTVDLLQREADAAGVALPPKYDFSFSAERPLVRFAAGSLVPLAQQLGEVKTILEAIYSARVNAIDSIQRVRVSEDDIAGPMGDYTGKQSVTNDLAVLTPYVVTFRCFTPELAKVIAAFAASSNAMLIKAINIQPAGMAPGMSPGGGMAMPGGNPMAAYMGRVNPELEQPNAALRAYQGYPQPATQPAQGKGGLQTVLKEQLLRVTMEVELVKLLPKS